MNFREETQNLWIRGERTSVRAQTKVLPKDHRFDFSSFIIRLFREFDIFLHLHSCICSFFQWKPMKRVRFLIAFLLFATHVFAQKADALAVSLKIDSLVQICQHLTGKTRFKEALPIIESTEKIALQHLGRNSAGYAKCAYTHGRLLHSWGKFEEAEPFYLEATEIQEKTIGKENPDYATSLFQLASLTKDMGNYAEAETMYLETIKIREKVLGKEHPDYAWSLNYLANLYRATGEYARAEPLCLESKAIREKVLGREHSDYAWSLNSLGNLYTDKGDYANAEPLYIESMAIREKVLGKDHPNYAASLNNLAYLYVKKGDFAKAEPLYLEAKERRRKVLGIEHPAYAVTLNNLAELYYYKGEYSKVESLFLEAKDIQAKVFGREHPDYALSLDNLANLYKKGGAYAKAEPLYLEAKNIREKSLGKGHPDYTASVNNLAAFYTEKGLYVKAKGLYLEAIQATWHLINKSAEYSSEVQQDAYMRRFDAPVNRFYSFSQSHPDSALLCAAFDNALFFNGCLLENSRRLLRAYDAADSLTRATFKNWQSARQRLAKRYARPIAERKKIGEVEAEAEGYEKMLMRSLPTFQHARKVPTWQDVRDRLKAGEAAIEFLHYRFSAPEEPDRIQYAALVLRPNLDAPKLIPLFEEKQLDSLFQTSPALQGSAGGGERKADYVSNLYSVDDRGIIVSGKPKKTLFELIWQPLEKELVETPSSAASFGQSTPDKMASAVNTVYFSPTGLLHRLNLGAIPINCDSTLADQYNLIALGSTRQLVGQLDSRFNNKEAILFGGIQFEMDSAAIIAANALLLGTDMASRRRVPIESETSMQRGGTWNFLKWTEKEVDALTPIISSGGLVPKTLKGFEATEEAFKSIGTRGESPRVLHLATHGFFFPDPKDSSQQHNPLDIRETGFKTSDNPLIRSGLLLAGANHAWKNGKPFKKGMENGILTAYEISHMNLSNTELVVLSACETGLGDIEGNEGVYGLQRAFKIAGVKYLVMSLWQVPDKQTQELMTIFYSKWLPSAAEAMAGKSEKMSLPEAFHSAQQEMREKYENPYFWAGFVLVE